MQTLHITMLQVRARRTGSTEATAGESDGWHQAEEVWGRACTAWGSFCQGFLWILYYLFSCSQLFV